MGHALQANTFLRPLLRTAYAFLAATKDQASAKWSAALRTILLLLYTSVKARPTREIPPTSTPLPGAAASDGSGGVRALAFTQAADLAAFNEALGGSGTFIPPPGSNRSSFLVDHVVAVRTIEKNARRQRFAADHPPSPGLVPFTW